MEWREAEGNPSRPEEGVLVGPESIVRDLLQPLAADCDDCHVWAMRGDVLTGFQQYTDTAQWQEAMGVR